MTEGMYMNINRMLETLPVMAKGMAGVFAVTLVIIFSILLLNRLGGGARRTGKRGAPDGADARTKDGDRAGP